MPKIESRTGKIRTSEEKIYTFLSNFNNFRKLIPEDKAKDWESTEDTCSFNVEGIGRFGLRIIEKEPNKLIKITSDDNGFYGRRDLLPFSQLSDCADNIVRFKSLFFKDWNLKNS